MRVSRAETRPWSVALALAAGVLFAACSREPAPPRPVPRDARALYVRIHELRDDYERGLELVLAGDHVAGRNLLEATTSRLRTTAAECARTPGCDQRLILEAGDHVLAQRQAEIVAKDAEPRADSSGDAGASTSPLVEAVPELRETLTLLRGTDLRERIRLNAEVKAALNDWLTWNRPALVEAHQNYMFLREKIAPLYHEAELPEALLFALLAKETGGKVHAYSRAGAAGPLQFMPRTARRYGLGSDNGFDLRLDPVAATRANVAYLNDQLRIFEDDLEKVLAAYNAGETRVRRLHRKHDGAEFWDLSFFYALPAETRDYVPQVLAAAWLYLHAAEYGLELPRTETGTTRIVLHADISLGELAICLGQERNPAGWFRTLRNLNPRIDPADRIPAGEAIELPSMLVRAYEARCREDSPLLALARELHDAGYTERPALSHYTVRSGDTLASIALRHGCTLRQLAAVNRIRGPDYAVQVGQRVRVPSCG